MLNRESLAQLKGLKTKMEAQKERAEAVVKGTHARYGFAVLGDGREIFIPPPEMLKAFPDDRVRVCIEPARDGKTVANIETLVASPLEEFTGQCVRKDKALFVLPDLPQTKRWLFIPPHARNGVQEGDYVRAAVLRHPIRDGRPQAKILAVLGNDDTPGIANLYCTHKYRLARPWSSASHTELQQYLGNRKPLETERRRDLTDLEFVSIDAAKTQDIDDALYAEISTDGWTLFVAIADPAAYIPADSSLYRDVAARGTSVYFHGDVIPMLPEELSQDICALAEGCDRPALVCKIAITDSGEVGAYEFIEARVRSRAKLSYFAVDRYLNGQYDELMSHATPLESLYQVYRALRARREEHGLMAEERQEYRWLLSDDKRIDSIEPGEKLLSQKLVEECMIATNRCAAHFLARHDASGPFISHPGVRADRREELARFLGIHAPELAALDPATVDGYRAIMRGLTAREQPLRGMLNRMLTRATLSTTPAPHMGMALELYTSCTSPLRRHTDLLVHMQIKSVLNEGSAQNVDEAMLEQLGRRLSDTRAATAEAERWLASEYLGRQAAAGKTDYRGRIVHITSSGFRVRLDANGLEGFVDLRGDAEKFSYDKWQGTLTSTTRRFCFNQAVEVSYLRSEREPLWQVLMQPLAGCGLKAETGGGSSDSSDATGGCSDDSSGSSTGI